MPNTVPAGHAINRGQIGVMIRAASFFFLPSEMRHALVAALLCSWSHAWIHPFTQVKQDLTRSVPPEEDCTCQGIKGYSFVARMLVRRITRISCS